MSLHQRQIAIKSIEGQNWSGKTFLDIGCSNGKLSFEIMEKTGAAGIVGVDTAMDRIAKANSLAKEKGIENAKFYVASSENLSRFPDNQFEIIFCNMAFQQFKNPDIALKEIYRVLAPDGTAYINFNIEKSPVWYQQEVIFNKLYGDPDKEITKAKGINPEIFENLAKTAGFSNIDIQVEDNLYYYQSFDEVVDKMDVSFFAKKMNLTPEQDAKLNEELEGYLYSTKTEQGIPESWRILFSKLAK